MGEVDVQLVDEIEEDVEEEDVSVSITRTVNSIVDCIEECLEDHPFDPDTVAVLSTTLFDSADKTTDSDVLVNIKAKIITRLLRRAFVLAALSKSQMSRILRTIKALVALISPENVQIAKKLHATYLSCQRERVSNSTGKRTCK